jgi:two-component system response regulator AtoC
MDESCTRPVDEETPSMSEPLMNLCTSSKMQPIRDLISKVAGTNTTVLLRGESGVGKEVVGRAIHKASPRAAKQFLKVNCAALPGELLESELFGHEKGAFTGAYRQKPGKFEAAHQGTLLLDEIGEMPLRLQAKLLHVLQDGEFSRVGGEKIIDTDVRLIAATNRDLEASMRAHQFREDLYYRLNVIEIRIPPLRERRDEIPALAGHFLAVANKQYGRNVEISPALMRQLVEHPWPGNIREMENAIKRLVVLGNAAQFQAQLGAAVAAAPAPAVATAAASAPSDDAVLGLKAIARRAARDAERIVIAQTLERTHWNRAKAARMLQISYKALLYKIVECGLTNDEVSVAS